MGLYTKVAGAWQEVGVDTVAEIPSMAASGGTETTVGTDKVHSFTASGTLTVTKAGYARVLVLGGGGAAGLNASGYAGGGGGQCFEGWVYLAAGSHAVTVGAAKPATANTQNGVNGNFSLLPSTPQIKAWGGGGGTGSSLCVGPKGGGFNQGGAGSNSESASGGGVVSNISGSDVEYGKGGSPANSGNPEFSGHGRVIIRYATV